MTETRTPAPVAGQADVGRAWASLLLYPFTFAAAFGIGEGLASVLGYPAGGDEQAPVWVMLTASIPALVVFAVPAVLATVFARRAQRAGNPRGRTPMVIALAVAGAFITLNVVSGILTLAFG
jgi:hypothetical protein